MLKEMVTKKKQSKYITNCNLIYILLVFFKIVANRRNNLNNIICNEKTICTLLLLKIATKSVCYRRE